MLVLKYDSQKVMSLRMFYAPQLICVLRRILMTETEHGLPKGRDKGRGG